MNSSIIHDNIGPLIRKKCHPKSDHSDIKYRMRVNNIIFSVVTERGDVGARKEGGKRSAGGAREVRSFLAAAIRDLRRRIVESCF
jgi:hypothetical protein